MSDQRRTTEAATEEVQLNLLPGSGEEQNHLNHALSGRNAASCYTDSNYRKLAICSVICGLSCIGCKALIYSVKVLSGVFTCTGVINLPWHARFVVFYIFWCLVLDSTGWRGDGSRESCKVFKASEKVWHHLHRAMVLAPGFHPHPYGAVLVSHHVAGLNNPGCLRQLLRDWLRSSLQTWKWSIMVKKRGLGRSAVSYCNTKQH